MRLVLIFLMSLISITSLYADVETWDNYRELPQYEKWSWMYDNAEDIAKDLNDGSGKYYLKYKRRGGSSHQSLVKRRSDDLVMGIWSAPNHATYILGEIFAFNLSRLLNRSQWSTPGTRMTLIGRGRDAAERVFDVDTPKARRCNRNTILNYLEENEQFITGAFMAFEGGKKPVAVKELVDRKHTKRLNNSHFLVKMIHRDGPFPKGRTVFLNNGKMSYTESEKNKYQTTDSQLAKQLSFMTLVDALNSQRDRFGPYGSNSEVMVNKNDGSFAITLVDNGGIADSSKTISRKYFMGEYSPGVSRFERDVFQRVLELDDFIQGKKSTFLSFNSVDELKKALGYENVFGRYIDFDAPFGGCSDHTFLFASIKKRWDRRFKAFFLSVKHVANYMRQFKSDKNAFFRD